MEGKRWYTVNIESQGETPEEDRLEELLETLEGMGDVEAPVVGGGNLRLTSGPDATFSIQASDPAEAVAKATEIFEKATAVAGIQIRALERVDVMSEAYQQLWLELEPETFVGTSEVAGILEVSKQRVSQLREVEGFPKPVAELASGPVWRLSTLKRFIDEWARQPGRPRKEAAGG